MLATMTEGRAQTNELRNWIGRSTRWSERATVSEGKHHVPEQGDNAIEQENSERRCQEAPDQHRLTRALARQARRAIGDRRSNSHEEAVSRRSLAVPAQDPVDRAFGVGQ